jgi:hypothetical protein
MRKRITTRQLYAIVAFVMVVVMAVGGSGLLLPDDGSGDESPEPPESSDAGLASTFPPPPSGTPQVRLGPAYFHPSGYFEIAPPLGWTLNEATEGGVASASWIGSAERAVVHAFTRRFGAPLTHDQLVGYIEDEFGTGFNNYDDHTVLARDYGSDPVTVDFSVSLEGLNFTSREWAGSEENIAWVLRIVVPGNYPELLDRLGELILPTYRVYPDAGAVPVDWEAYSDQERSYAFRHPPGWARLGTGADGALRFADSETRWQTEMAVLVQPDASIRSEEAARAWLEALQPDAQLASITTTERSLGEGYVVSFSYPAAEGQTGRGVLLLLNANDAVYRVDMRLPLGAGDPLKEEAQQLAQQALEVLDSFTPLQAEGPIPPPVPGGVPTEEEDESEVPE